MVIAHARQREAEALAGQAIHEAKPLHQKAYQTAG